MQGFTKQMKVNLESFLKSFSKPVFKEDRTAEEEGLAEEKGK